MTRAVLSLGSNVGHSRRLLADAVDSFGSAVRAVSGVYRTPPWGGVPQDDFLNVTLVVDDPGTDARGWLIACRAAEDRAERARTVRWGPRTLDADVIAVWNGDVPVLSGDPELLLPHPRAAERAFVLLPWREIEPDAELPGVGRIGDLVRRLDTGRIRRLPGAL